MKGKKGDASEIIYFIIILFFLAVSFTVALYANSKISDVISTTALNESSAAPTIISAFNYVNETVVQRGYIIMFAMLILGLLISSFLVRVHPIFIFIYIITLAFAVFLGVYLANIYETLIGIPEFAGLAANQTMITYVMQHAVKILIATWALSMIILFGKIFMSGSETGGDYA